MVILKIFLTEIEEGLFFESNKNVDTAIKNFFQLK